ncbi:uncharacterized protein LOC124257724 [Haliotis rubra]|uniref:uncharacterized protein LOC124257724 n=1 Tax=Haliotis rubra TaxID=36100 RepID=UPI001EE5202F|nr:uncharacterized protein LOC124257724 [Haliotis rubra]XP_046547814.1 uncharacterized protein LOC124257724 [Haliotis rubra]
MTLQRGFKSIALPAVGIGQLGYPPSTLAKILMGVYREIASDTGSDLQVFVFVEPPKHRHFQAIKERLQDMDRIFIGREAVMIGTVQLQVVLGEAKLEDADLIVYITQPGAGIDKKNQFERTPWREVYTDLS